MFLYISCVSPHEKKKDQRGTRRGKGERAEKEDVYGSVWRDLACIEQRTSQGLGLEQGSLKANSN